MNVLVDDDFLIWFWNFCPHLFGFRLVTLDDEVATFFQTSKRIGVFEYIGIRRQDYIHEEEFTIDAYGLGGRCQIVSSWLTFLFWAVFWIGFDVIIEQIKQGHGQVFTSRNSTPTTYWVKSHCDGTFGHQIRIFSSMDGKFFYIWISITDGFLVQTLFWIVGSIPYKVNRKIKLLFMFASRHHVFYRTDDTFGLKISTTHSKWTRINWRNVPAFISF